MTNNFYKRNYYEALEKIIPQLYLEEDLTLSGEQSSVYESVVNSHLVYAGNESSFLNVSATDNFSDINSLSGMSRFFVKQNKLTDVSPESFELDVLLPLGSSLNSFTTSASLLSYLSGTLLPKILLNQENQTLTVSAFDNTASGTHEYLINSLGWGYFLNTSAPAGGSFAPSAYIAETLTSKLFNGQRFTTKDGIVGLSEYLWKNWDVLSSVNVGEHGSVLPLTFYSGTGEYVSGTQGLDKLKTLVNIIYNDQTYDEEDRFVEDAFIDFIHTSSVLDGTEYKGPFSKLLKGISYSVFDTNNDVEGLTDLYDIEKCPKELLPYLADLIGWKLVGSNEESWRRQIRSATTLYKKKGTKEGIIDALGAALPSTSIEASSVSEFYESYIPFLIYYLLKTDSDLFDTFDSWNLSKAEGYTEGEHNTTDMDLNIRLVVDHLLLKAVKTFPELFYVKNYPFDINDPKFRFYYRGRAFCIPPWEEEKFYKNCDVTEELLIFIKNELICLGVTEDMAVEFFNFCKNNTIDGEIDARFYNNSMLFLTSSLVMPPNRDSILDNYQFDKYEYLPLWNGKSSTFDVNVSSGTFDSKFFSTGNFRKEDFFQSLRLVDEFSPAKAIPRTRVDLGHVENIDLTTTSCPSVRYAYFEIPTSGFQSGMYASGVDMRSIDGFIGSDYSFSEDLTRGTVDHSDKPVFKREQADSPKDVVFLQGSGVTSMPVDAPRTNTRRRSFEISLPKSGFYTRDGFNMPSYYNLSDSGTGGVEFWPLGRLSTEFEYHPVIDPLDLDEVSSAPYNFDLWNACWSLSSSRSFSGIQCSDTFPIRGEDTIEKGSCNSYVARDRTPEFVYFLWDLLDNKLQKEAEEIVKTNELVLDTSTYDNVESVKNWLWNNYDHDMESYYYEVLGKRIFSIDSLDGIHKTFKDYIDHFTSQGLGNDQLEEFEEGGLNILSHIYGPINYNGNFLVEGSGVNDVSSQLISESIGSEYAFALNSLTSNLNNLSATTTTDLTVGSAELRNPYILSGVEFCDLSGSTSKFSIFDIDPGNAASKGDNFLVDNPVVVMDPLQGFPRVRFSLKDYGPAGNLLIPDRDFKLEVQGLLASKNNYLLGGGSFGIWIHTDYETDHHGNEVFWTYMPSGEWKMLSPSALNRESGPEYVRNNLAHIFDMPDLYSVEAKIECFAAESEKNVLASVQESDFQHKEIYFNTRNPKQVLPLAYYQKFQQLHRSTQNYIIEIFPYNTQSKDKFAVLDFVKLVDLRQSSRTSVKHSYEYKDYRNAQKAIDKSVALLSSDGSEIPYGTTVFVSETGDITTSSGDKVTFVKSESGDGVLSFNVLYNSVSAKLQQTWNKTQSGEIVEHPEVDYFGPIMLKESSDQVSLEWFPERLSITGLEKGSNVTINKFNDLINLTPQQVLFVLREFNRLQKDVGARNSSISEDRYGTSGGGRLNYRSSPMWFQTGSHSTFVTNDNQYTDIEVEN